MPALTQLRLAELLGTTTDPAGDWSQGASWRIGSVICVDGLVHGGAEPLPARLLKPRQANGAAIVYCHAHGGRYDIGKAELTDGRPALLGPPLGLWLAERGFTLLCADMPGFGARRGEGAESALAKAALWRGRPLLGHMLDDVGRAGAALARLEGIDRARIAVLGFSMGATLAYFRAALTPAIAACAHLCAFAQIAPMIETGAHDGHGPYMTVPGLLPAHDLADVAALVAPRPHFAAAGRRDLLTPPAALDPALERLRSAYAGQPERLRIVVEPEGGHAETTRMRTELLEFLAAALNA